MDRVEYQSLVIQDIINLQTRGELNTNPWYQRRSVWTETQKSYLINTLFEKKPIPALYIRHSLDLEKSISIKEIVDGQQRTRSIIEFANDVFPARHPVHANPLKFSQLTKTQRQDFLLTAVPVGYLLGATDSDVIDIFARINSVSKTLNDQEKRNALYSGEFKQFCVRETVIRTEFWKKYKVFSANDIARMNEVQFISDVIINLIDGLSDFSQPRLNKKYKDLDERFPNSLRISKKLAKIFDQLVAINPESITETIFDRQPIFFSLILVLDKVSVSNSRLQKALLEIDNKYNSDKPVSDRPREDANFYNACRSSTQRLANRKIRDSYILKHLS